MYIATITINGLTVTCWGETLDKIDRLFIIGDITAQTFNPEFYEQIKTKWSEEATLQPF